MQAQCKLGFLSIDVDQQEIYPTNFSIGLQTRHFNEIRIYTEYCLRWNVQTGRRSYVRVYFLHRRKTTWIYPSSWHTGGRNWNSLPSHSDLDGVFQRWLSSQALAIINISYLQHGCRLWQTEKCRGQNKENRIGVKYITLHLSPSTRKGHVCDWTWIGREMKIIYSEVRTLTKHSHSQL